MTTKSVNRTISRYLIEKYSNTSNSQEDQILESLDGLIAHSKAPKIPIHAMLSDTARIVHRLLGFKEVAIGLKDSDGLFRYALMLGYRDGAEVARKKISYSGNDMSDLKAFPGIRVGRFSRVHIAEDKAYKSGEELSYNRPSLLGQKRLTEDSMIEGDYIEVDIHGLKNDIIGWIEVSGSRDGKLPSRENVIWLELIAATLGCLIRTR